MPAKPPMFIGRSAFGVRDREGFFEAQDRLVSALENPSGIFMADNLIAFGRNLGFLSDSKFIASVKKHAVTAEEIGTIWRLHTLVWAAHRAVQLSGDFVECACYKGTTSRIIADLVDLSGRRYYLYDLFEHDESMDHHSMPMHSERLFDLVLRRFPEENIVITKGRAPDSFSQNCPSEISLLHLDMNNADSEIAVLDALYEKIVPGGMIVLDDFGWLDYRPQFRAEQTWFRERNVEVLELPTGQGIAIKPHTTP